mmetsp:Transcript_23531/g.45837  ORF Transcript_23531/g.45837 Transcript_23531/m.45837 type:complete len:221 (-) Transcript_23531:1736-2398(-)
MLVEMEQAAAVVAQLLLQVRSQLDLRLLNAWRKGVEGDFVCIFIVGASEQNLHRCERKGGALLLCEQCVCSWRVWHDFKVSSVVVVAREVQVVREVAPQEGGQHARGLAPARRRLHVEHGESLIGNQLLLQALHKAQQVVLTRPVWEMHESIEASIRHAPHRQRPGVALNVLKQGHSWQRLEGGVEQHSRVRRELGPDCRHRNPRACWYCVGDASCRTAV